MAERHPLARRVVVVLDASPENPSLLEAAADLARRLQSELLATFVEDANLMRLTELPFLRAVDPFSGAARELNSSTMERAVRAYATRAEETLSRIAAGTRIRWSFSTVQGTGFSGVLSSASDSDLVILGGTSGAATLFSHEPPPHRPGPVLVLRGRLRPGAPVVVLYPGPETGSQPLQAATFLAEVWDSPLVLLAPQEVDTRLPSGLSERLQVRLRSLQEADATSILEAIREEGDGALLVLPVGTDPKLLRELLESGRCPVMIVP
ncbi:hypothetical protein [Rubrobacter calidifluminis]|uniref:hypothetical protein n=1 Tax=Rubrobacter calidifluminis TaxID=1392640 RepID=UPI0023626090|nr:hypothetical protein [Rubrobacter calidifluminis]